MYLHKYTCLLLSLCFFVGCTTIKTKEDLITKSETIKAKLPAEAVQERSIEAPKILPYEKLIYDAKYLGIHIGEFIATNHGLTEFNGQPAYKLEVEAHTNRFFSRIFKVRDRFVTYMDPDTFNVLRHEVYREEGKYQKQAIIDFDHKEHKAYYKHLTNGSTQTIDIPEQIVDVVCVQYFVRSKNWSLGDMFDINVYVDEKVYELAALVKVKQRLRLPKIGWVDAFKMEPYAMLNGEMVKKGKAYGHYWDDENRTPIKGVVKTPIFGKTSITLKEIRYQPE